jgi:hypothetical protein
LGGIEQAVLNLSAALTARGHVVRLGTQAEPGVDFAVAVNDARLLPADGAQPILWFHNEVTLWREMRRGRLGALARVRPAAVVCGTKQARRASWLMPTGRRIVLPHGLPVAILSEPPADRPPPHLALFTSQAYRGLGEVIELWRRRIATVHPTARLRAYVGAADLARYRQLAEDVASIGINPRVAATQMPQLLRRGRLLVAPGHASETFCLAAAEAVAMGVPVVTYGRGALAERVAHGRTGFICRDEREMAARILALLSDDELWLRMQAECLVNRADARWDRVAGLWERAFLPAG